MLTFLANILYFCLSSLLKTASLKNCKRGCGLKLLV